MFFARTSAPNPSTKSQTRNSKPQNNDEEILPWDPYAALENERLHNCVVLINGPIVQSTLCSYRKRDSATRLKWLKDSNYQVPDHAEASVHHVRSTLAKHLHVGLKVSGKGGGYQGRVYMVSCSGFTE